MIERLTLVALLGLGTLASVPAQAQQPEPPRVAQLRAAIEQRFAQRLIDELGLNDEQATKVRGILATWSAKRRGLEQDERELRAQLADQMRPGVAADEAVVVKLTDRIIDGRIGYVETFKSELKDLSAVLTPVQRAQYLMLRDRLNQRVQDIRNARPGAMGRRQP